MGLRQETLHWLQVTADKTTGRAREIMLTAIEDTKKQTPKKPIIRNVSEKGKITNTYYFCYICDNLLSRSCHEYCPGCGQAIDWD